MQPTSERDRPTGSDQRPHGRGRPPTIHFETLASSAAPHFAATAAPTRPAAKASLALPATAERVPHLLGAQPVLDSTRRISVQRLLRALQWWPPVHLENVEGLSAGVLVLRRCASKSRTLEMLGVSADPSGRLTLSPALCWALGSGPGEQVQAIAHLEADELIVTSMSTVLHHVLATASSESSGL